MTIIIKLLLWFWQLPQHVVALVLLLVYKPKVKSSLLQSSFSSVNVYRVKTTAWTGVSLGQYIFIADWINDKYIEAHEGGHSIQSLYLGPLYLIVVGIPSALRNLYLRIKNKSDQWYYDGFPENWADRIMGIKR